MKPGLIILVIVLLFASPAYSQKGIKESVEFTTPPVIDGESADWPAEWLMDSKSKFLYNVGNDSANLYVRVKVSDLILQQKVGLFGFTVFFYPEGGKKNKMGLHFPLERNLQEMKKEEGENHKTWNDVKKDIVREADLLEIIGLAKERVSSSRLGLGNGIQVILVVDAFGDFIYEAKFPFKAFRLDRSKLGNIVVVLESGKMVVKQNLNASSTTRRSSYGGAGGGYGYGYPMNSQPYNVYSSPTYLQMNVRLK